MTMQTTIAAIGPADAAAMTEARDLQARLTKPAGSLGQLEDLSIRLSGLAEVCPPPLPEPAVVAVFAGDHGVHAQQVTPWPQEVTGQMVANMLAGGAVVNAFARQVGAAVTVIDIGVATPPAAGPATAPTAGPAAAPAALAAGPAVALGARASARLIEANVRRGTRDMTVEAAMTRAEATAAIEVGIRVADELVDAGAACLITGDMGIANTTASAALIAAFTGASPAAVTGRGTGVDADTYARKIDVVTAALTRHNLAAPDEPAAAASSVGTGASGDPLGALAAVGGLEHAGLVGLLLGAAARRVPVIVDGVIAVSSALVAAALAPHSVAAMVAGHRSVEPGATVALVHLGLTPLLDLGLRLGEGTGAVLALPVVASAVRVLHEGATFDAAGVSEK